MGALQVGGDAGSSPEALDEFVEDGLVAASPRVGVASVAAPTPEGDEEGGVGRCRAEGGGVRAVPDDETAGRRGREPNVALACALAEADVEHAHPGAFARGQEVAAVEVGKLLAAQTCVAENAHDCDVARPLQLVAGLLRLGGGQEAAVYVLGERRWPRTCRSLGLREAHG